MVNTPIPHSLKSEAKKAAKILRDFSMPNAKTGPDQIIPADTISNAAGLCILSVFRVGFLITARGGSGIVIARDDENGWSAPSAIGIAGLGGGFEIGAEVTDFVIILNKRAAVEAFSKGGNLTIGGNFSVAAGPVGRNMEGDVSVRSPAAIYTYSKTKGLFAGVSIEGSYLIERKDANKKFYGGDIRAYDILSGDVERPPDCFALYEVLDKHQLMYLNAMEATLKREAREHVEKAAKQKCGWEDSAYTGSNGSGGRNRSHSTTDKPSFVSRMKSVRKKKSTKSTSTSSTTKTKAVTKVSRSHSSRSRSSSTTSVDEGAAAIKDDWAGSLKAIALWDFDGLMPCDLSFKAGEELTILTRTDTQADWWEASLHGRIGILPANYVQLT